MYFLYAGVVLTLMKYLEIDPVASWAWWVVLTPFGLASAWWIWADTTGYTKKKAMEREDAKRDARIAKNKDAMGTLNKRKR
ncbi:TIGR04438 family Trp-rich protein [Curvibacter sp. APW13]|uniref:TIGR04438 family Trp-rich protein n=1 Tax=Curvibacter sp. APW13 TaxID=3077236 RepID=UPI0028DFE66D|nr:TIGR04438 family Trp-rich protein [Curvibacter sp. APW13]MDT8991241.1 TIGR04438 family Trp-rich protein [Curvibacter sp. APW13]